MKDKHKREKALKEILEQKNNGDNSMDACVVVEGGAQLAPTKSNGMVLTNEVVDITDDAVDSTANVPQMIQVITSSAAVPPPPLPLVPPAPSVIPVPYSTAMNNNFEAKMVTPSKLKSLTNLPLPPGTNLSELVNAKTPSPPHESPLPVPVPPPSLTKAKETPVPAPKGKKSLLNLPMPAMVAGSEDVSGDEDESPRKLTGANGRGMVMLSKKPYKMVKRPIILNRRNSRSAVGPGPGGLDWGERSVDVFQVLDQIGEGTYGQVRKFYPQRRITLPLPHLLGL